MKEHTDLILNYLDTVSFLVIRNPMDRLVSAFKNKMECRPKEAFVETAKYIVKKFRPKGIKTFGIENYDTKAGLRSCRKPSSPTF